MCVIKLSLTFCSSRPPQLCWKLVHRVSLPIHSWLKQDNYKIETFTFMQGNLLPFQFGWNPVLFVSISVPSAQFQIPFCSTFSIPPTQTPKFARSVYLFLIPPNQIVHCLNLFWFYLQIQCQRTAAWSFKDIGRDLKDVVIVFLALASPGSPLDWILFVSWWLNWSLRIPYCYFKTMSSVRWGQWLGASIHSLKVWRVDQLAHINSIVLVRLLYQIHPSIPSQLIPLLQTQCFILRHLEVIIESSVRAFWWTGCDWRKIPLTDRVAAADRDQDQRSLPFLVGVANED